MTNPQPVAPPTAPEKRAIRLHWTDAPNLPQVLADEAVIQGTGDRIYVTVGQVQLIPSATGDEPPGALDIAPVARLVFTTAAFLKFSEAIKKIAEQVQQEKGRTP